ncbi:hypothetical protein BDR04DRAFT_997850, partial [Suillus decipiens]
PCLNWHLLNAGGALGFILHYLNSTMQETSLQQIFALIPCTGAFRSIDGLKLPVQTSEDDEIENATYNGWLSEHFISSVITFSAEGVVIAARINVPGSWHDSHLASHIYTQLWQATEDDMDVW